MRIFALAACLAFVPALFGCVGDDSTGVPDSGADTNVPNDGQSPDVGTTDVAVDSPIVCDGGATVIACGSKCVDIATSGANCGACGHDCGGGMCSLGTCQPQLLADSLDHPPFDVDATNIYFPKSQGGTSNLVSCPKSGCVLQPTTLAEPGIVYPGAGSPVFVLGANVSFYGELANNPGHAHLFACDSTNGCSNTPVTLQNAGLQSFDSDTAVSGNDIYWTYFKSLEHASCTSGNTCGTPEVLVTLATTWPRVGLSADANGIYYVDQTAHALVKCGKSGACTPTTLLSGVSATTSNTFAYNNSIYVLDSNMSGYAKGVISVCPNAGACTPTTFLNALMYPTLLWVDAQGVYWYESDTQSLKTCPLTGCKPSARTLVTGTVDVIRTDASFVYWATDTQILRVAK